MQSMEGGEPITDTDAIALAAGLVWVELAALIEVGITVGYREDDDGNCTVGLSAKGHAWYERGRPLGSMLRRQ